MKQKQPFRTFHDQEINTHYSCAAWGLLVTAVDILFNVFFMQIHGWIEIVLCEAGSQNQEKQVFELCKATGNEELWIDHNPPET